MAIVNEEQAGTGSVLDLALGTNFEPHVLILNSTNAWHAHRAGNTWTQQFVAGVTAASMDVDPGGAAHIAYSTPDYDGDARQEAVIMVQINGTSSGPSLLYDGYSVTISGPPCYRSDNYDNYGPVIKFGPDGDRHIFVPQMTTRISACGDNQHPGRLLYRRTGNVNAATQSPDNIYGAPSVSSRSVTVGTNGGAVAYFTTGGAPLYCSDTLVWTQELLTYINSPYGAAANALSPDSTGTMTMAMSHINQSSNLRVGKRSGNQFDGGILVTTNSISSCDMSAFDLSFIFTMSDGIDHEVFLFGRFDQDDDGISDEWEVAHGTSPTNGSDAVLDLDLDGFTAREEYICGTDPADDSSVLALRAALDPAFAASFETSAERWYQLETISNLMSGSWAAWLPSFPGTGNPVEVPIDANNAANSVRVKAQLPDH